MSAPVYEMIVVSHTHWDREWYRTFQDFRLSLVRLIDDLLDILDDDPAFHSFMLDGQTIILEDYLALRPEREADLRRQIQSGRLVIGPWHILPDEFLAGPESTVRNLMLGAAICGRFGERMLIGYTPDPFGHISQLPQILAGAGVETAIFRRGLSEEPLELWWEAPDGTRVLALYLREGYGNLEWAPTDPAVFTRTIERQIDRLGPHTRANCLLLLNGTDHQPPQPEIPALIGAANAALQGRARLRHGTIPAYVRAVRAALGPDPDLPVVRGELRSPRRHHLLPGVLSTRMWIKQHNQACETLLERYAEPLAALGTLWNAPSRQGDLWQSWRYLIENHPHDSICGCSIDQVHDEMRTRFAWSAQIAGRLADEGLRDLAAHLDTAALPAPPTPERASAPPDHEVTTLPADLALVVFNPVPGAAAGRVEADVPWLGPEQHYALSDDRGEPVPAAWTKGHEEVLEQRWLAGDDLVAFLEQLEIGIYLNRLIRDARAWLSEGEPRLELILTEQHPRDVIGLARLARALRQHPALRAAPRCRLTVRFGRPSRLAFEARDVPGTGWRSYRLRAAPGPVEEHPAAVTRETVIENAWLRVEADPLTGHLSVLDKATGRVLRDLNAFEDGGDRGDEYNYCPPERDRLVQTPAAPPQIERVDAGPLGQALRVTLTLELPARLAPQRDTRSAETVRVPVVTTAALLPHSRRLDIHTALDNRAEDHRLRALFPSGVRSERAIADGHFDRIARTPQQHGDTTDWAEQPQPTAPQRGFVAVEKDGQGMLVAVRGLPEYELIPTEAGATLAVTLLRSVGWLSRGDLACRVGHAGPEFATPGGQCLGPAESDISVIPFGGAFDLDAAAREAYTFGASLRAAVVPLATGPLPATQTVVALEPAALVLSAIKPAEAGQGLIVRFYNSSETTTEGRVRFGFPVQEAVPVNLLEAPAGPPLALTEEGALALTIPAKRIVTLAVTPVPLA